MPRFDHSSAIALAASLLLHGAVLYICAEVADHSVRVDPRHSGNSPARPLQTRILVDEPSIPDLALPPLPSPKPATPLPMPLPTPEPELPAPQLSDLLKQIQSRPIIPPEIAPNQPPLALSTDGFGELTGSPDATSLHSLSGDLPMQARQFEKDQPYISRDPSGQSRPEERPALADQAPLEKSGEQTESGQPAPKREPQALSPEPTFEPLAPPPAPAATMNPALPGPHPIAATQPAAAPPIQIALATPPVQNPPTLQEPLPADPDTPPLTPGSPSAAASPSVAADPAPKTDSESDPFSTHGSAEFRPGKVTAHFGRKVKTVRPRLSLAGQYDLITVSPEVVMNVRTDETGKVREVRIVRSSGSPEVDQPCKLAMYEWWFEPPRDPAGNPRPAEMVWTISFRAR